ncbi:MAG: hypothetical protein ACQPRH_04315 [Solitalea-like symbiont of Tyrophagus putrescentiae]
MNGHKNTSIKTRSIKYKHYLLYILISIICASCGDQDPGFVRINYNNIEHELLNRYNQLSNTTTKPDYYTSGILIHGLNIGENGQTEVWIHRKIDKNISVAFSYLRKDNQFITSAYYDAGFIFYPYGSLPEGLSNLKPIAAFPFDAGSDARKCNDFGAGAYCKSVSIGKLETSELEYLKDINYKTPNPATFDFKSLNIASAQAWFEYLKNAKGFDLLPKKGRYFHPAMFFLFQPPIRLDKGDDASNKEYFALMGPIRKYLKDFSANNTTYDYLKFYNPSNNEILIEAWDETKPELMPIEYFFFTINDPNIDAFKSMRKAVSYQQSFLKKTGRDIPIVAIQFPREDRDAKFFRYDPNY